MNTEKTKQLLPQAFSLHQAGKIDEAEAIYRTILEEDSANPQVLSMLGMLSLQRGNWEEGISLLNATLKIDPDQPDTLNNLGYALQTQERHDEALECYDKAVALFPNHASAYYNKGRALQNLGRYQDAVDSLQKALSLRPNHADTCINLGNAFAKLKRHDDALTNYIKALNLRPNDPGISNNLGLALKQLARHKEALTYFRKAIALQPNYADAHFNLAAALQEMGRNEEALASYDKVLALQPGYADAHCMRGQTLQKMERHEEALAGYEAALAIEPEHISALTHLGVMQMELGKNAESASSFIRALEIAPESAEPYYNLAILGQYAADEKLFKQLESLYTKRTSLPDEDQVYLDFAMGKAREDAEQHEQAFEAYEAGNRLYHHSHPVDETAADKSLEESVSFFTAELFDKCRALSEMLPPADEAHTPIFIVGMPRSGTTLIEQILSSHPAVFGAGELKTFDEVTAGLQLPVHDAPEWNIAMSHMKKLGQNYLNQVWKQAPDARHITDKMPGNFMHLGLLHLMLPNAKIIHAMRDPMDSCLSCYTHHFREQHAYAYDLGTLGRYYQRYQKLMQHWHSVLPAGSILDVRYEEVVADPEHEIRRLLDHIGVPWDDACLKFHENKRAVRTASLNQVRKPIYTSSVARWKHFEKHLGPLLEIVGNQD